MVYPKNLHHHHNHYPFLPKNIIVGKEEKIVPNLRKKEKYVTHYKNLKLYDRLALKITNIHIGIKFKESACL